MKNKCLYFYINSIRPNKVYFWGYLLFLLILFSLHIPSHRDFLLEWFNSHRTTILNYFFIYASKIAEEEGILFVFVFFLLFRYSLFVITILSVSLSTLLANIIKTITNLPRPLHIYEHIDNFTINLVPGVEVHRFMSFPSGHTAAAFAMLFFFLFLSKNTFHRLAILILSALVGFSRIYLFQHFTQDVLFASILGLSVALTLSFIFIHFNWHIELDEKQGLLYDLFLKRKKPSDKI